jgi:branched-chain amino acid transport system permease protein
MYFLLHLTALIAMSIPHALGYNIIFGKGKILHFGPVAVSIVTAYTTFVIVHDGGSYPLAILCGLAVNIVASTLFAWLSCRMEEDALGILTIAMHLAMLTVVLNWSSVTRGAQGIPRIPRLPGMESQVGFTIVAVALCIIVIVCARIVDKSALGRRLQALSENAWHAQAMGMSKRSTYVQAFVIGGLFSAVGSILYPQYLYLVHPSDYTFPFLIFYIMVIVAGRPGNVVGVCLSLIFLTLLREGLRFLPIPADIIGPIRLLLFGGILLATVWMRRKSLFPPQRTI